MDSFALEDLTVFSCYGFILIVVLLEEFTIFFSAEANRGMGAGDAPGRPFVVNFVI